MGHNPSSYNAFERSQAKAFFAEKADRPMKILHITSKGFAHGGAEQILQDIHASFVARGYSIRTLASDLGPDKIHFNEFSFRGLHAFSFIAGTPISRSPFFLQYIAYPFKLLFFLFNPFSFFALKKVLHAYRPDVVHLHTMIQVSPSVLFLLRNYPTVMTLWGPETFLRHLLLWCLSPADFKRPHEMDTLYPVYTKAQLNGIGRVTYFFFYVLQKLVYKIGLKQVDIFLAPSMFLQHAAQADVSPIVHIPTYTELQPFSEIKNVFHLLFVGRLVNVKGVEFLIQAMPTILKAFPQAKLTIVGDGFGQAALKHLTHRLHLDTSVHFAGWIPHEQLGPFYEDASVVVIPSVWPENFPTVCAEAMSSGRPVIGTKVGGIPELIDEGENGYLVEAGNSKPIAAKVIQLFSDEGMLRTFGKNARLKAERFHSKEQFMQALEEVYETVVSHTLSRE